MEAVIEVMRNKEMGRYKASRIFNLPHTTLQHYVKDREESSSEAIKTKLGRKQVHPCEAEKDLAEHCRLMERKFLGLTMADIMNLTYQLIVRNGIKNQFCKRNEKTGRKWLKNYLSCHQEISVSLHSQEQGVSLLNQQLSFLIYELAMDTIQLNPARLYNCNETGITIVQHKHTKISGLKGKHQISSVQSANRGYLATVITCMSPTGHLIPPLLVFTRKYMKHI